VSVHVTAIVAAAGRGTRLGTRKQFLDLQGKPVAAWCLETFAGSALITDIVIACEADEAEECERVARRCCGRKLRAVVSGGERRQDSVFAGLRAAAPDATYVLVHDGARPFVSEDLIARALEAAQTTGASVVAIPVKDTIKQSGPTGIVTRTVPREQLWAAQTPQVFAYDVLYKAYEAAETEGFVGTDDAMLVEWAGTAQVAIVEGSSDNIKITTPEDLALAERIAKRHLAQTT
jgi:2-C-methyl-D-erythritol 4-phosphate cytidylyltransferase